MGNDLGPPSDRGPISNYIPIASPSLSAYLLEPTHHAPTHVSQTHVLTQCDPIQDCQAHLVNPSQDLTISPTQCPSEASSSLHPSSKSSDSPSSSKFSSSTVRVELEVQGPIPLMVALLPLMEISPLPLEAQVVSIGSSDGDESSLQRILG